MGEQHLSLRILLNTLMHYLEEKWYWDNNCEHVHCPKGCEHPQEALTVDGRMICMRCWVLDRVITEVEPCTPNYCED